MALVLRSNPSRLSSGTGALFVSNPKRKASRKVRRNAKKKTRRNARKTVSRKRKNPVRKRKAVARKNPVRKRKAVARKNPVRKRSVRRNALAIKRNPVRKRRSSKRTRMNPLRKMLRKNPSRTLIPSVISSSKKMIARIPYVGKVISQNLSASVGGMLGGLVFAFGYKKFSDMLAEQSAQRPDSMVLRYVNNVDKYAGLALIGIALAGISKSKLAVDLLGKETSDLTAKGLVAVGGALQAVRLLNMYLTSKGKATVELAPQTAQSATAGIMYGDGGSYDVVPLAGVQRMGMMHGVHMNGMHKNPMHGNCYGDAKPADAALCHSDMSAQECRAAMSGDEQSYAHSFEQVPKRITNTDIYSCFAGKHGHRWGWMIKMIGFDRFRKLAMLPPVKRVQLIAKMIIWAAIRICTRNP